MEVSFVRVQGSPDRIYVHRTDGSEVSWTFPTYGEQLPHDLVHMVVEAAFGLRSGFWGRVDAGVDPSRINAMANKLGGKDKYAGFGADRGEIDVAEALAAAPWSDRALTDEHRQAAISEACAKFGAPAPDLVTIPRIAQVRETLDRLRAQWRQLIPKGTIKLVFDPKAPEASFERM